MLIRQRRLSKSFFRLTHRNVYRFYRRRKNRVGTFWRMLHTLFSWRSSFQRSFDFRRRRNITHLTYRFRSISYPEYFRRVRRFYFPFIQHLLRDQLFYSFYQYYHYLYNYAKEVFLTSLDDGFPVINESLTGRLVTAVAHDMPLAASLGNYLVSKLVTKQRRFLLTSNQRKVRLSSRFWHVPNLWRQLVMPTTLSSNSPTFVYRHLAHSNRIYAAFVLHHPNFLFFTIILSNPYFWGIIRHVLHNKYKV
jgi:hypothetical protein